ncbi:hypothetical protein EC970010_4284 [Escherichia coli 97.0010]|nr:hypothetical protein EC970007_3632 [Escherichia coli 97.0007]EKY37994.1 hypothetical protein EC970010_4284 [Escherichia coli 97.0010]
MQIGIKKIAALYDGDKLRLLTENLLHCFFHAAGKPAMPCQNNT